MKFWAFILAAFLLFLALKPGIDLLVLHHTKTSQTCCSDSCSPISNTGHEEQPSNDSDCENKACNPFQACHSCVLAFTDIPTFYFPKPKPVAVKRPVVRATFQSQFSPDFWQPPKLG